MATYRKLKSSGHCEARIFLGRHPVTKKPLFESKTHDTKTLAREWATEQEAQRNKGSYQPTSLRITFAEYLRDRWLPVYASQVRNAYNVERAVDKWIFRPQPNVPALGGRVLRKLTVADFDKLYEALTEQGMKPRAVRHLHGLLKQALKFAVKKGELATNPAQLATVPKHKKGKVRYLTDKQEARFIAVAKRDRWSALWHLLLDTGLRPGEALALKWTPDTADEPRWGWVDLDEKLVKVRATLMRVGVEGWTLAPPKTDNSTRDVPICDDTVVELRRWKKQQAAEHLQAGPEWQDHGFVFTTQVGSPLGNNIARAWERVMREADQDGDLGTWGPAPKKPKSGPTAERSFTPKFSMYVLRHTMATLNYLDGMDLGLLSRRLGHASYAFTFDTYARGVGAGHTTAVAENTQRRWRAGLAS